MHTDELAVLAEDRDNWRKDYSKAAAQLAAIRSAQCLDMLVYAAETTPPGPDQADMLAWKFRKILDSPPPQGG